MEPLEANGSCSNGGCGPGRAGSAGGAGGRSPGAELCPPRGDRVAGWGGLRSLHPSALSPGWLWGCFFCVWGFFSFFFFFFL